MADIEAGKRTHPLNIHFTEAHEGQEQTVLMSLIDPQDCPRQSRTPALVNKCGDIGRRKPETVKKGMRNKEKEEGGEGQQKDEDDTLHPRKKRKEGETRRKRKKGILNTEVRK